MYYKSNFGLLGLPLVHITTGKIENGCYSRGIAKGWIAIGDISFGVIFSIGGVAFGGVAIGGLSVGLFSLAGLAIGLFALGGGAFGIMATGGVAIAWKAALGGFSIANRYAQGGMAIANNANDYIAKEYFEGNSFFRLSRWISEYSQWFLLLLILPVIQTLIRKRKHRNSKSIT